MSQMTEIILSQWVIAVGLGALCLGLLLFGLVPAMFVASRVRSMKGAVSALRSDSAQLKERLVDDLRIVLERLAQKQIDATTQQQAQLCRHLSISLQQPLEKVAQTLEEFGANQSANVSQGMQTQMTAFAERLDELLGGQVSQARELQEQTARSLENTVAAFHTMAKTMSASAENTTQFMVTQLRASVSRSQAETDANVSDLINKLTAQVSSTVAALEQQAVLTAKSALDQQQRITEQAQRSIESLSSEVRTQTKAIEAASQAMRTAGTDVASAVDRIIEGMTGLISGAAQEFMRSGQGFAEIFNKSAALSHDLSQTATALASSSKEIGVVVEDYQNARHAMQGMVETVRSTVESARKDATVSTEVVGRMEAAAQKLIAAQSQADDYLARLSGVLTDANGSFGAQMLETVRNFQEHVANGQPPAPPQIADESQRRHSDFDRMISDWVQTTPRLKQNRPPAPPSSGPPPQAAGERVPQRPMVPMGNGTK